MTDLSSIPLFKSSKMIDRRPPPIHTLQTLRAAALGVRNYLPQSSHAVLGFFVSGILGHTFSFAGSVCPHLVQYAAPKTSAPTKTILCPMHLHKIGSGKQT